jgi:CDP-glucose 4,6-dehydratase
MVDKNFWRNKKVLLTGHTGFKGAWLSQWLIEMGAMVSGLALDPITDPNLYETLNLKVKMNSFIGDISDFAFVSNIIDQEKPEVIFHLAAQALVHDSYEDPLGTLKTNLIGTANILEAARNSSTVKVVVNVTSDKCYQNDELSVAFVETDRMGGNDIYSCSKGCSELITHAFRKSFFDGHGAILATARAGNVIGGGDWSKNRLVPDIIKAFGCGQTVNLRNPYSIRPWQHVLEPLSGYLLLAEKAYINGNQYEGAWNFGPGAAGEINVEALTKKISEVWGKDNSWTVVENAFLPESSFLKLDCAKSKKYLGWNPRLTIQDTVTWTADWYKRMYQKEDMEAYTIKQIRDYIERG